MTREEAIRLLSGLMFKGKLKEALDLAIKALEQEPRKGHWIKTPEAVMGEGYMWYCDKCKHQVYQDSSRPYPSEKHCPNCGAKMESEDRK